MTREEAKDYIREWCPYDRQEEIIKALEEELCEDCISRAEAIKAVREAYSIYIPRMNGWEKGLPLKIDKAIYDLPSIQPKQETGHCKECKYFEYDSVAKVEGIPLIVAHEICKKWGDGCKTSEDGYCFLFEPQERSDKE